MNRAVVHLLALMGLSVILGQAGVAHAHPLIEGAVESYQTARFQAAIDILAQAEDEAELTLIELGELYEIRALAHAALGDEEAVKDNLTRLAYLDGDHAFRSEAPPEIIEQYRAIADEVGRIRLSAEHEVEDEDLVVTVEVRNDPLGLVKAVRVDYRIKGGDWVEAEGTPVVVPHGATEGAQYYAVAVGPGQAIVAEHASSDDPIEVEAKKPEPEPLPMPKPPEPEDETPWLWIGIGAAVLIVGGLVAAWFLVRDTTGDNTQPSRPILQM